MFSFFLSIIVIFFCTLGTSGTVGATAATFPDFSSDVLATCFWSSGFEVNSPIMVISSSSSSWPLSVQALFVYYINENKHPFYSYWSTIIALLYQNLSGIRSHPSPEDRGKVPSNALQIFNHIVTFWICVCLRNDSSKWTT